MRPLIGITCSVIRYPNSLGTSRVRYGVGSAYTRAVERAGGIPLLIPPLPDSQSDDPSCPESLRTILDRIDGLLLSGGGDIDPRHYGEERLPICGEIEPGRDDLELALARLALAYKQPVFGICRGIQLLNVARGGTLYQDLTAQRPGAAPHPVNDYEGARDLRAHAIDIAAGSPLEEIVGARRHAVNSFHHQAVKQPGAGLEILAWSEDGIVEAMALPEHPFALAVQFHPEETAVVDEASQRLFDAFVRACAARMGRRGRSGAAGAPRAQKRLTDTGSQRQSSKNQGPVAV
jgi:putative glutamine amidotransferase